ncbi:hypothetical protein LB465_15685 [Salegentibacter sp. LM13S]|uniref:hypothetical protein n=1 Tax=Salegentibacter lacus TaxID=2873599 RepID=UPI001CC9CCB5|nr:hypothetical protein [Salegentibacter lacus]MBZ9632223.1 hypothetical protein [Salegentibacter lacus]
MKIRFKKKRIYPNLILGLFWMVLGIYKLIEDNDLRWPDYLYLIAGILFISYFFYDLIDQYLTIETGTIRKNILYGYPRRINLDEVNLIKKTAGGYTLQTESQKMKIKTDLIEGNSLTELKNVLESLNLRSDKTPFANNKNNA